MASPPVAVSMGSTRSTTIELEWLHISDVWFPADAVLPTHTHDRPVFAVALEGALDSRLPGRRLDCDPDTVWTEPAGERHSNFVGAHGARVMAILPDAAHLEALGACATLLDAVHHWRHGGVAGLARRMAAELRTHDDARGLALEGLALETLAVGMRSQASTPRGRMPAWLGQARDLLHDRAGEHLEILDVARHVGVGPQVLARAFRTAFGVPLATYHRRIRLDRAARQLVESATPIATVALRAGFYDQPSFTRHFRRHTGCTPAEYRRAHGSARD